MDSYRDSAPIWDFTNPASGYTQMQDIDFMALLDKQYSANAHHSTTTDAAAVSIPGPFRRSDTAHQTNQGSSSSNTPPFNDNDTPSPSDSHDSHYDDGDAPAPKRKATREALEGPNSKTMKSAAPSTSTSSRRKSTGNVAKDESRLLKRKEQNRAAQRAFRERKEKHVRDLEEMVAALEAKNEEAVHENENLRDLLTRLQTENVMLKQGHFTFSMPRDAGGVPPYSADDPSFSQNMPSSTRSSFAAPSAPSRAKSPNLSNPLDWSSLTTFDPSRLNLLDDLSQHHQQQQQQPTATDSAMQLDFGFGPSGLASSTPFTTLASNPMFMSFASSFDTTPPADSPSVSNSTAQNSSLNFDINSLTSWPLQENSQSGSFDDLFPGYSMNNNNLDFSFLTSPASISPISHHVSPPLATNGGPLSLSSSPSSSSTDPLYTPKDSPHHDFDPANHDRRECPKTKAELVECIEKSGPSPFAPSCAPGVKKSTNGVFGAMITCEGSSSFPKTQKNDQNVEVLSAWRSITSNPKFKDTDISELCAEFTAKARCDGTKVVLEPASVDSIIETLSKKRQGSPQDPLQPQQ